MRYAPGDAAPAPVLTIDPFVFAMRVDGDTAFAVVSVDAAGNAALQAIPLSGGAPVTIAQPVSSSTKLAVTSTTVYWVDGAGVQSSPRAGGPVTAATSDEAWALTADASGAYAVVITHQGKVALVALGE
jgi:hypothetical protein